MRYTPIQKRYKDEQKRSRKAKELATKETIQDDFYLGKSTDQALNMDTKEINSFYGLD